LSATRAGKNIKRSAKRKRKRDSFKHCRAAAAEFLFLLFFFLVPFLLVFSLYRRDGKKEKKDAGCILPIEKTKEMEKKKERLRISLSPKACAESPQLFVLLNQLAASLISCHACVNPKPKIPPTHARLYMVPAAAISYMLVLQTPHHLLNLSFVS
jgi:cbb3-type cytochrome oxidase subunit 3